ncbi:hypothetical protein NUU61_008691 [Penicillium alfredii]|uniref:Ubiquitin carboxyl-terminal hydrolase 19 n=1 Tax=Penicillium alfredii TaxID=1506179 RepID=A0A9W9ELQ3_9EURO|nr:uncharacterized protein NUU61_008691 [Penicillium alfredii]KAJ5084112.1 hypothetical protein NUU61_008691 [Penicillium alfredii]
MDAQYPFASRDDIWRVFDELKELHVAQFEQSERIGRLERRRDDDARLRSVWGPLSPFPSVVGGSIPADPAYHSPPDAFKGFDQGQHHTMANSTVGLDGEEEPRRGASRANSVRFDESAIHGYYGQAGRPSTDLPLRTGSGLGSHPLTERSLSHRSEGRQSSSGHSHHSARTNSLGLDTSSRLMGSSLSESPLIPPPGLFLLGPVPCIIRCWLTTNFSNDSLLYAAVCSGSFVSSLGMSMVRKFGLEDLLTQEDERQSIKLPLYLPEASIHQSSPRSGSPVPQLPAVTIRFLVREADPIDESIQIIFGSDVLRAHNADILFSQDKMIMVDDERNRISVPLVRPEKDSAFRTLSTFPDSSYSGPHGNGNSVGVIGQTANLPEQSSSAPASARVSIGEADDARKHRLTDSHDALEDSEPHPISATADAQPTAPAKPEGAGVWSSWRRDPKPDPNTAAGKSNRGRTMKVLRSTKLSSRVGSTTSSPTVATTEPTESSTGAQSESARSPAQPTPGTSPDDSRPNKPWAPNPVGGASAFGWLNPASSANRTTANPR